MAGEVDNNVFKELYGNDSPRTWQHILIGRPLATADAPHQTIGKLIGLAVFASDALSSTAYATQEILIILAAAGSVAFSYAFPIAIAIALLMLIVTLSYEQTVHAYPSGGGAYIVARDNLGNLPAQMAAAALLTDYILTVAVSVSSGVAQIVSAFPNLYNVRVHIAILMVGFVMLINLRGVKESGLTFAVPTYFFVLTMFLTVGLGLFRHFTGALGVVPNPPEMYHYNVLQVVTPFLILHAFSSGTAALTGIEAISNGITAFKEPRSRNAGITLLWMSAILGTLFLGITYLSRQVGVVPSEVETVISQLARTVFGGQGLPYLAVIAGTAIILILAANTAFADFPRLGALVAADGYLPRQLSNRGSRLVFSRGIIALAIIASGLIIVFQASVTRLIPLYAIGVFLSFTLSQVGMAHRWWKVGHMAPGEERREQGSALCYEKGWQSKMIINGFGGVCTFIVMLVFAMTKFRDGAYLVIVLIPTLVGVFLLIRHHYKSVARQLSLENVLPCMPFSRNRILIPVGGVHQGTLQALRFARTLSDDITAVHVSIDPDETEKLCKKWEIWGDGYRLVILDSPYRLFIEPLLDYIEKVEKASSPTDAITILVPQFIPHRLWSNFLHTRTAETLRKVLLQRDDIVIVEVPYQVK